MPFLRSGTFARTGEPYLEFAPFEVLFPVNHRNRQLPDWRWRYWENVNDAFEDPEVSQLLTAPLGGLVVNNGSVNELDPVAFSSIYFGYVSSLSWSFTGQISASIDDGGAQLNVRRIALSETAPIVTILETYASQSEDTTGTSDVASVALDLSTIVFPASRTPVFIYMEARAAGDGGPRPANSLIELEVSDLT